MLTWLKMARAHLHFEAVSLKSFARRFFGISSPFLISRASCLGVSELGPQREQSWFRDVSRASAMWNMET